MSEHLWREYKETGDLALRNRLVLTYVPTGAHARPPSDTELASMMNMSLAELREKFREKSTRSGARTSPRCPPSP
jgi:hypothetical protein